MSNCIYFFFFSSRRRHTRWTGDWSSDVCSSDLALEPERTELRHEGLGLAVGDVERLDHGESAVGDPRRDRGSQRLSAHRARQVLLVAARLRTEGLPAALPLGRADRALTRATGPLLFPGLPAAARDLAAAAGGVSARAPV